MTEEPPAAAPEPIAAKTRVRFHPYAIHRQQGHDPMIEREGALGFMEVSDETLHAMDIIARSDDLASAEVTLLDETAEEYDLVALATALDRSGFVIHDGASAQNEADIPSKTVALLHEVACRVGTIVRHPMWILAVLVAFAIHLEFVLLTPITMPGFTDLFIASRPSLNMIFALGGMLAIGLLHECAHFCVATSYGVRSRMGFGHRLYMFVLTTDVTPAWKLPRRQQIAIFSAGPLLNLALAAIGGIWYDFASYGLVPSSPLGLLFLRYFVALNIVPVIFQLFFTARTDLYYIFQAAANRRHLGEDSRRFLKLLGRRIWSKITRKPALACTSCKGAVFPEEPFCLCCGLSQPVHDQNLHPYRFRDRHILAAFGGLTFLAGSVMYPFILFNLFRFLRLAILVALAGTVYWELGRWGWVAECAITLALISMQLFFVAARAAFLLWDVCGIIVGLLVAGIVRASPVMPDAWGRIARIALRARTAWQASKISRGIESVRAKVLMGGRSAAGPASQPSLSSGNPSVAGG